MSYGHWSGDLDPSAGEVLAGAELGTIVVSGDGGVTALRCPDGPRPWALTGSAGRWTNGDLLAMAQDWRLLHSPAHRDVRTMLTEAPPGTIVWAAPLVQYRDGRPPRPRPVAAIRVASLDDRFPWTTTRGTAAARESVDGMLRESREWHVAWLGEWPT